VWPVQNRVICSSFARACATLHGGLLLDGVSEEHTPFANGELEICVCNVMCTDSAVHHYICSLVQCSLVMSHVVPPVQNRWIGSSFARACVTMHGELLLGCVSEEHTPFDNSELGRCVCDDMATDCAVYSYICSLVQCSLVMSLVVRPVQNRQIGSRCARACVRLHGFCMPSLGMVMVLCALQLLPSCVCNTVHRF
jgi:hypothetical protein